MANIVPSLLFEKFEELQFLNFLKGKKRHWFVTHILTKTIRQSCIMYSYFNIFFYNINDACIPLVPLHNTPFIIIKII